MIMKFVWGVLILAFIGSFFPFLYSEDDDQKTSATETTASNESSINKEGRDKLLERFNDPGYVESSFPSNDSFWILIKEPPNPADMYASMACTVAKNDYNTKGFTVTVWGLNDQKEYGKARCF